MADDRSKRPNQPSARQLHEARIEEVRRSYDEIEAIMADPDVAIELLEQAGFTVIRPDEPAVPESMEPAAVVPPTRRQLMMLASDMGMASIDEAVMKFALAALARWGQPATPPAVTTTALLHPAYEPGDGSADGAQIVDLEWWHPVMGCDSLQVVVDNARAAPPAPAEGELVAASRPVTLATVGEDFYRNSPIARAAVIAAISEAELIRNLLENERRLTELATGALHSTAHITLMVPPKQEGLTEEELEWAYQSGYQPAWERGEFHAAHLDGLRAVAARLGCPAIATELKNAND